MDYQKTWREQDMKDSEPVKTAGNLMNCKRGVFLREGGDDPDFEVASRDRPEVRGRR
jgi:hypothetical protein